MQTAEATLEIRNRHGLHLRAASALAQTLKQFTATVTLTNDGQKVSGRSVTQLLMLGAAQGTRLKVRAEGDDAVAALAAVTTLFEQRFGEE